MLCTKAKLRPRNDKKNFYSNSCSFCLTALINGSIVFFEKSNFSPTAVTSVLDGKWHHLMAVYNGSEIRLYVDGELDASTSTGEALRTSSDPVYIGSRVGKLSDRSWNGQIDEVRIYDTALSDNEMLWLSEGEPYSQIPDPPRPTDLVLDGQIDMDDLRIFVEWWLKGTD